MDLDENESNDVVTHSPTFDKGQTDTEGKVEDMSEHQEPLPTMEIAKPFLPEFTRVQLTMILNSKKIGDYDFPEDLAVRVETIVDNIRLSMSYGSDFQKVVRKVREEFGDFESKIMAIIRQIVTDQHANVAELCSSGMEFLSEVGKVYGGLSARIPPLPDLPEQTADPERSCVFMDFIEYETIRFVSYAALFYYLKGNRLPSIQTVSSILGCQSPLLGKNAYKIKGEIMNVFPLEQRVMKDFQKRYPDLVEDEYLDTYLKSIRRGALVADVEAESEHFRESKTDVELEIGDPVFNVQSVGMGHGARTWSDFTQRHPFTGDDNPASTMPSTLSAISENEYLIGVLYTAFQLTELGLMGGTHGDCKMPGRVAEFLMALHNCYLELDHVNGPLRRTFDRLKYELRQANAVAGAIQLKESLQENPTEEGVSFRFRVFDNCESEFTDHEYNDEY